MSEKAAAWISLVTQMPCFHCRRHGFNPWLDELISSLLHGQKQRRGRKKRKERQEPNKAEHER